MANDLENYVEKAVVMRCLMYCQGMYMEELRKDTETYNNSKCSSLNSEFAPPEYNSSALPL